MRLSDLKTFIDTSVRRTAGKYREFATLHLTPVPPKKGFEVKPLRQPN